MLDDPPMLKVRKPVRRLTEKQIKAFAGANTSNVADCMDGRGAMHHSIKPLQMNSATFCGPALTCFAYPADNLAVMGALTYLSPATSSFVLMTLLKLRLLSATWFVV